MKGRGKKGRLSEISHPLETQADHDIDEDFLEDGKKESRNNQTPSPI